MRFGVLGTGVVGATVGAKLVALGHEVKMGSRRAGNEAATQWAAQAGAHASQGAFADAAAFGEVIVNATNGQGSLDALKAAGAANLAGKLLIDIANPLDFSQGMPPRLSVCNTDSLSEQIQRAFPDARVVKSLNTINADIMVNPGLLSGEHAVFMAGDDAAAKEQTAEILESFGWPRGSIIDLGGIAAARGLEMYLPLWLSLMGTLGDAHFNVKIVR